MVHSMDNNTQNGNPPMLISALLERMSLPHLPEPGCGEEDLKTSRLHHNLIIHKGGRQRLELEGNLADPGGTEGGCACVRQGEHCICAGNGLAMSALYPEMRFSWEIKSVDDLFGTNKGQTRLGDLTKEGMLQAIRDKDLRFLQDSSNLSLLSEKKFSKECVRVCVKETRKMDNIEELLDFFMVANDETRRNVTGLMKEAVCSSVRLGDDALVIGILEYLQSDKKIKTLTDTAELIEDAVHAATVEQSSDMLNSILKWNHNNKIRKLNTKNKDRLLSSVPGPKINCSSVIYAAKWNDYERVKILLRYGYRLKRSETITDPLKKIELFKALASPAFIVASLEHCNEVSAEFFCPVKMCFEFAREANFRKSTIPEYKREYEEIEIRCEAYAISLLEQCEDLREVETFLQTRNSGNKDTNYMLAILDSRMKFVAHERFQYVLLKKFGETELEDEYDAYTDTLWIDMPMFSRVIHVLKQVPCYLLLFLYPFFYPCLFPSEGHQRMLSTPWFCKEWRVPLNRAIYTAFSYICFICLILCYVTEPSVPYIYWIDGLLAIFITSYSLRDIGTAFFLWRLEGPNPNGRRFKKRYFTFWNEYNIIMDLFFFVGLVIRIMAYTLDDSMVNLAAVEASGRIFWGVAFTLAVFKMIKIGIVSKHFGPIILSMKAMLKDIFMFLITFFVIMLAFSCGVSYMYNYIGEAEGASTNGIFTYFFWVLLQPFRGNPGYDEVTNLPYDTACLTKLLENKSEININSIEQCKRETMYNSSCLADRISSHMVMNESRMAKGHMHSCIQVRRLGEQTITTAVVPMWIIYQFLVSVVLLRILIVMMTITYKKIYDNLDTQWKYWRLYLAIQFFDSDSLLPPPFTHLTLLMYLIRWVATLRSCRPMSNDKKREAVNKNKTSPRDTEYRNLLFAFIDNVKPKPNSGKVKKQVQDNNYFLESM